ncbi:MAG: GHMP kinase [Flavobacteriaceae bacterium]|nr:GHMP kinase [Flavobacteriaceae bacterium]
MKFYSNGKLLITSEYLVLDGAKAFALPTKYGQSLEVKMLNNDYATLFWESIDYKNGCWFKCEFNLKSLNYKNQTNTKIAKKLQQILIEVQKLNPSFLQQKQSLRVKTTLDFNKNWGLGSSSTLINNIANWAKIDAFKLQHNTFGGSAYDIACAQNNSPILYQLKSKKPKITPVNFNPKFTNQLYFIYLNKKKNSRIAIKNYQKISTDKTALVTNISAITNAILKTNSLIEFEKLIEEHENLIAKTIQIKPIKQQLFKDYFGSIKSLGAWEGDFILATGNEDTPKYFSKKGFETILFFKDIIL